MTRYQLNTFFLHRWPLSLYLVSCVYIRIAIDLFCSWVSFLQFEQSSLLILGKFSAHIFLILPFPHSLFFFFKFFNFILFIFLYSRFLLVINFIHISVYMSIPIAQFITPHPQHPATFPIWCPYVCSLHLCLNFCLANWFICTIFLGSTYMR